MRIVLPGYVDTSRPAFTLIELLVVIAIISLLVSILMPMIQKGRELAKKTLCMSNCHQIFMAESLYAQDNDMWITYSRFEEGNTGWFQELHRLGFVDGTGKELPGGVGVCPSEPNTEHWGIWDVCGSSQSGHFRGSHYGINYYVSHVNHDSGITYVKKFTQIRRPSERLLLCDAINYFSNPYLIAPYRHLGGCHLVFIDGTIEGRRQEDIPCCWNEIGDWHREYFWGYGYTD